MEALKLFVIGIIVVLIGILLFSAEDCPPGCPDCERDEESDDDQPHPPRPGYA